MLFQVFNSFNARFERRSALSRESLRNRWLWLALAGVLVLQVAVVHVPLFQSVPDTTGLSVRHWALAAGIAASVLVLDELRKLVLRAWGRRGRAEPARAAAPARTSTTSAPAPSS